jgi:hypothetical protein
VDNLWEPLKEVFINLGLLAGYLLLLVGRWALVIAWFAWWLWGVNWSRAWLVLGRGAWLVVVLLMLTAALVWSQVAPSECTCLGFTTVANFWWQLGAVALVTALTLFCGWLQGVFGWAPAEVSLESPEGAGAGHGHH